MLCFLDKNQEIIFLFIIASREKCAVKDCYHTQLSKNFYFLLNIHKLQLSNKCLKVKYCFFSGITDVREKAYILQNIYI